MVAQFCAGKHAQALHLREAAEYRIGDRHYYQANRNGPAESKFGNGRNRLCCDWSCDRGKFGDLFQLSYEIIGKESDA